MKIQKKVRIASSEFSHLWADHLAGPSNFSQRHPFLGEIWVKVELLSLNLPSLQIFLSEPLSNITFLG